MGILATTPARVAAGSDGARPAGACDVASGFRASDRTLDDQDLSTRTRPRGSVVLARGTLGYRAGDQRDRARRALSLWNASQGTLVACNAGCDRRNSGV